MTIPSELKASFDRASDLAQEPASVEITVGVETANVRPITFQVKDANGGTMRRKVWLDIVAWATSGQAALTAASTGLTVTGTTISIAAWTAAKVIRVLTDANGKATCDYTDTATATCALEAVSGPARALSAQFANA